VKLVKQSLNYSRDAGNFTVEGKGAQEVANLLSEIEGIEGQEWDTEYEIYSLTWDKNTWDWDSVKDHYKAAKEQA